MSFGIEEESKCQQTQNETSKNLITAEMKEKEVSWSKVLFRELRNLQNHEKYKLKTPYFVSAIKELMKLYVSRDLKSLFRKRNDSYNSSFQGSLFES